MLWCVGVCMWLARKSVSYASARLPAVKDFLKLNEPRAIRVQMLKDTLTRQAVLRGAILFIVVAVRA